MLWHTSTVELPADRRQSSRTGSPWVDIVFSSRSLEDNCRRAGTRGRLSIPRHQDQSGPRRSASCSCGGQRKGEMYPICFQKSMPSCFLYKPSDARCFSWLAARRASDYCQWVNRAAVAPPILLGRFAIATSNADAPDATGGCAACLPTSWAGQRGVAQRMNNSARLLTMLDELAASDRRSLLNADLCAAAKTGRKASGSRSHRKNPAVGDTLGISNS